MPLLNLPALLENAPRHLPVFQERTAPLSKEEKGIRMSEMFFLYATVADLAPRRIIESGRARAQSTLVLSALFPGAKIISIESNPNSPDVAHAEKRLRGCGNVESRFGDSRVLLPELVEPGDVVLIDGPKDFRALKLALGLLASGQTPAVFVHDLWRSSSPREFVERCLPTAFLSDDADWVRDYARLDSGRPTPPIRDGSRIVYGATLGCLPAGEEDFAARLWQCRRAQGTDRVVATLRKLGDNRPFDRPPDFTNLA